jgi:hypothetical protein
MGCHLARVYPYRCHALALSTGHSSDGYPAVAGEFARSLKPTASFYRIGTGLGKPLTFDAPGTKGFFDPKTKSSAVQKIASFFPKQIQFADFCV